MSILFTGVDPGLVHTGVVTIMLDNHNLRLEVTSKTVDGPDAQAVLEHLEQFGPHKVIIEDYSPRLKYNTDTSMRKAVFSMKQLLRTVHSVRTISNFGVKKVVTQPMMLRLNVWSFPTPTHHQDLRAAARIGLYGALKDEQMNFELYTFLSSQAAYSLHRQHQE